MFSFNVIDSPEQLPLKKYTIDWGDGFNSENNASLSDKSDTSTPVEMYHFYDYWKVQSTATGANVNSCPPVMNGTCCDRDSFGNYCKVNAVVNVVDNWGATGSASALFTIYEDK